ncbi:hypothetical protein ACJIZ3_019456 [Penstemon smallii]|uniref:Uncharacterized protein n=1 Tax=Penstemon smallii TaxID=265156 RepID=A0ABD3T184_9LAMI
MIVVRFRHSHNCKNPLSFVYKSHVYLSTSIEKQPPAVTTTSTVSEFLLQKHKFSPQTAARVSSVLTHIKHPENSDSVISFFKENGFSNTQLEKIVKYRPSFLSSNLEKSIKPKIKIFQDLGFSSDDIAKLISVYPAILHCSPNNRVIPSLSILKGFLGSEAEVARVIRICGALLTRDLEKILIPNVKFLESCGVKMGQIKKLFHNFPRYFLHKPEMVKKFVNRVDVMGVSRSSKMFVHAVGIAFSMNDKCWELKLQALRNMGFSENDIAVAFRKSPMAFASRVEKMKAVMNVLLATGKYSMPCIIRSPASFTRSIEKKFKPQFKVLEILESHNLIKKWPPLATLCAMSEKKFYGKYVGPYLDKVGHVYVEKSDAPCSKNGGEQYKMRSDCFPRLKSVASIVS